MKCTLQKLALLSIIILMVVTAGGCGSGSGQSPESSKADQQAPVHQCRSAHPAQTVESDCIQWRDMDVRFTRTCPRSQKRDESNHHPEPVFVISHNYKRGANMQNSLGLCQYNSLGRNPHWIPIFSPGFTRKCCVPVGKMEAVLCRKNYFRTVVRCCIQAMS